MSRVLAAAIVLCLVPAAAQANGNVSHLQVTLWARDVLPAGDLRDLLERPDVDLMLQNGANFPDGGYAVDDGYGEIAHWEPFQTAYLDWIRETYDPPWSDEAGQHIAFLMGMASHGMSDQTYDCTYLARAWAHDEGSPGSSVGMDGSTDVAFAAEAGPLFAPELWVPDELMAELMEQQAGHAVDPGTIRDGQALVAFSLYWVSNTSVDPDEVAAHHEAYPWACAHQMDEEVPGNPPLSAPVVAAYWERLWQRLHGEDFLADPLLVAWPDGASEALEGDPESIESLVSFVVGRGLDAHTVTAETVAVTDSSGAAVPVDVSLCYSSHVVNLRPVDGWAEDDVHRVSVGDGVRTWDGLDVPPFEFTFEIATDAHGEADTEEPEEGSCACSSSGGRSGWGAALLALVGLAARRRRGGQGERQRSSGSVTSASCQASSATAASKAISAS